MTLSSNILGAKNYQLGDELCLTLLAQNQISPGRSLSPHYAHRLQPGENLTASVWTWTALDSDSKLIISFRFGDRGAETANFFMHDLQPRIEHWTQLTTDGHRDYLDAVAGAFADDGHAREALWQRRGRGPEKRYSPAVRTGAKKVLISGNPDKAHFSTPHVKRQNLTMHMSMCRFTRLTNAFSKKIDSRINALSLYFVHYNFARVHKTLRMSPAMAAGISDRPDRRA